MIEKIEWSEWFPPNDVPMLGDYVQIQTVCIGCGTEEYHEGIVSYAEKFLIRLIPKPQSGHADFVMKWRRRIIGILEESEREREVEAA